MEFSTGILDHWPAMKKWTWEYLKEKIGPITTSCREGPTGEGFEIPGKVLKNFHSNNSLGMQYHNHTNCCR